MQFDDLLIENGIDPTRERVLVLRHKPSKDLKEFKKEFNSIAVERADLFNAYQSTQSLKVERQFKNASYVASFIGHASRQALFVGVFRVGRSTALTKKQFWEIPAYKELGRKGMKGFVGGRKHILKFHLNEIDSFRHLKGKLIVDWPGAGPRAAQSWSRWANGKNKFFVRALLEESKLNRPMPVWTKIVWPHSQLKSLPQSWQDRLSQWRGIYYVFDNKRRKGYVGSAYGHDNILGRWRNWSRTGHGGNKYLRKSNPRESHFQYP